MRRAVWTPDGLAVVDDEPGELPAGWARMRTEACGICGSDLSSWLGEQPPVVGTVPGHEFVGTLVEAPPGTADVRYAVSPIVSCGACAYCARHEWNLCRRGGDLLGLGRDGGLAEWVDVPVAGLVPLPDGVSPLLGMLTEPTAVACRGVGLAALRPDDRTAVVGAGTIGLLTAAVARTYTEHVTIAARHPHQAAIARALGLDVIGEAELRPWGKSEQPRVVFDTVGGSNSSALDIELDIVRRGGTILVLGTFRRVDVDLFKAMLKEVALVSSYAYGTRGHDDDFQEAVGHLGALEPVLDQLISHRFPLDQVTRAFETARDKSARSVKVAVVTQDAAHARGSSDIATAGSPA